jgi:hypothetical protein
VSHVPKCVYAHTCLSVWVCDCAIPWVRGCVVSRSDGGCTCARTLACACQASVRLRTLSECTGEQWRVGVRCICVCCLKCERHHVHVGVHERARILFVRKRACMCVHTRQKVSVRCTEGDVYIHLSSNWRARGCAYAHVCWCLRAHVHA